MFVPVLLFLFAWIQRMWMSLSLRVNRISYRIENIQKMCRLESSIRQTNCVSPNRKTLDVNWMNRFIDVVCAGFCVIVVARSPWPFYVCVRELCVFSLKSCLKNDKCFNNIQKTTTTTHSTTTKDKSPTKLVIIYSIVCVRAQHTNNLLSMSYTSRLFCWFDSTSS